MVVFDGKLGRLADRTDSQCQDRAAVNLEALIGSDAGGQQFATQRQHRRRASRLDAECGGTISANQFNANRRSRRGRDRRSLASFFVVARKR